MSSSLPRPSATTARELADAMAGFLTLEQALVAAREDADETVQDLAALLVNQSEAVRNLLGQGRLEMRGWSKTEADRAAA